uniref:Uncharacterized protein n=1 Tax=Sinocyclocheilus grahami TaxID=75366 RepID=A0A672QJ36_SINGR
FYLLQSIIVSDIVLAAGADRTIQVFDMNQGCMATQIPDAHSRAVHHLTQNKGSPFCTQVLESYNLFMSSAITDGLKLWDLRTARCVRRYESHVNRCHHCTAAFSPCGRFIATGSEDHSTYIYDTRSSNFLHKLPRHSETVLNVAFNPNIPEPDCQISKNSLLLCKQCNQALFQNQVSCHYLHRQLTSKSAS